MGIALPRSHGPDSSEGLCSLGALWLSPSGATWEFPKLRGTLFWGPYNKDPTINKGTISGCPIFGSPPFHRFLPRDLCPALEACARKALVKMV